MYKYKGFDLEMTIHMCLCISEYNTITKLNASWLENKILFECTQTYFHCVNILKIIRKLKVHEQTVSGYSYNYSYVMHFVRYIMILTFIINPQFSHVNIWCVNQAAILCLAKYMFYKQCFLFIMCAAKVSISCVLLFMKWLN